MDGKSDNQLQNDSILPVSDVDRSATTVEQHIEEEKSAANGGNLNTKGSDDEGGECSATNIQNTDDETPKSTDTETIEKSVESTPIASSDTRRAPNSSATGKTINKRTSATDLSNLSRLLGAGGKKSKMSTLEKSQLDWNSYKAEQQIGEELETHNRGRDGYLERQDFLIRADHRQFEAERSARNAIRKK